MLEVNVMEANSGQKFGLESESVDPGFGFTKILPLADPEQKLLGSL